MNTHRRDPRTDDDVANEEDDDVEEDKDERDEAVTGGAASPCVPPVASAAGPGPRFGAETSALISLSRGDALRSGDMDRAAVHGRAPGREVYASLSTIRPSPSASSAWPRPQQSTHTPALRLPRRLRVATAAPRHEEHGSADLLRL